MNWVKLRFVVPRREGRETFLKYLSEAMHGSWGDMSEGPRLAGKKGSEFEDRVERTTLGTRPDCLRADASTHGIRSPAGFT
jgi:hypothetical protein